MYHIESIEKIESYSQGRPLKASGFAVNAPSTGYNFIKNKNGLLYCIEYFKKF